jgi:uncharacterized alkaline shock family protein YloU
MKTEQNKFGEIEISSSAIADLVGLTASSVYGVVGLVQKNVFTNHLNKFLKKGHFDDGVFVKNTSKGYQVSLYLVVSKDVKIIEVIYEVQKQVSYILRKNFSIQLDQVNVYIKAVK